MILLVTSKTDITADLLVLRAPEQETSVLRLNTEDWISSCSVALEPMACTGVLEVGDQRIALNEISAIYYRRPRRPVLASGRGATAEFIEREATALLYTVLHRLDVPWISDPALIRRGSNKALQLAAASAMSFDVPRTLFTSSAGAAAAFVAELGGDAVIKTIDSPIVGHGAAMQSVYARRITLGDIRGVGSFSTSPSILQALISPAVDIRVTVVGELAFAVEIQRPHGAAIDWRAIPNVLHLRHSLPSSIESRCLAITRHFGLRFSAIDLCLDGAGRYWFLELNPNGEWGWMETELAYPISTALLTELRRLQKRAA